MPPGALCPARPTGSSPPARLRKGEYCGPRGKVFFFFVLVCQRAGFARVMCGFSGCGAGVVLIEGARVLPQVRYGPCACAYGAGVGVQKRQISARNRVWRLVWCGMVWYSVVCGHLLVLSFLGKVVRCFEKNKEIMCACFFYMNFWLFGLRE